MDENLKVLAHNKGVKQFFMHDVELLDGIILPGIVHVELEENLLAGLRNSRRDSQVEMVFDGIGYCGNQFHSAPRAIAGSVGPDVAVHRAEIDRIFGGIRSSLNLPADKADRQYKDNQCDRPHRSLYNGTGSGLSKAYEALGIPHLHHSGNLCTVQCPQRWKRDHLESRNFAHHLSALRVVSS